MAVFGFERAVRSLRWLGSNEDRSIEECEYEEKMPCEHFQELVE